MQFSEEVSGSEVEELPAEFRPAEGEQPSGEEFEVRYEKMELYDNYEDLVFREEDGRYGHQIPWKHIKWELENNFGLALARFRSRWI